LGNQGFLPHFLTLLWTHLVATQVFGWEPTLLLDNMGGTILQGGLHTNIWVYRGTSFFSTRLNKAFGAIFTNWSVTLSGRQNTGVFKGASLTRGGKQSVFFFTKGAPFFFNQGGVVF